MAVEDPRFETPTDPLTLQALPIYFTREHYDAAFPVVRQHHAEHPALHPDLANPAGQLAVRTRVYMVPDALHLYKYPGEEYNPGSYHNTLRGPYIPPDDQLKVNIASLNLARVVPRSAIELDGHGGFAERLLTDEEHAFLSSRQIAHIENKQHGKRGRLSSRHRIAHTMIDYAISQGIHDLLSSREVERFLRPKGYSDVVEVGDRIIMRAVEEVAKPAEPIFIEAVDLGMVDKDMPGPVRAVQAFLTHTQLHRHYDRLHEVLAAQRSEMVEPKREAKVGAISLQPEVKLVPSTA